MHISETRCFGVRFRGYLYGHCKKLNRTVFSRTCTRGYKPNKIAHLESIHLIKLIVY